VPIQLVQLVLQSAEMEFKQVLKPVMTRTYFLEMDVHQLALLNLDGLVLVLLELRQLVFLFAHHLHLSMQMGTYNVMMETQLALMVVLIA